MSLPEAASGNKPPPPLAPGVVNCVDADRGGSVEVVDGVESNTGAAVGEAVVKLRMLNDMSIKEFSSGAFVQISVENDQGHH